VTVGFFLMFELNLSSTIITSELSNISFINIVNNVHSVNMWNKEQVLLSPEEMEPNFQGPLVEQICLT